MQYIALAVSALLIGIDQLTKWLAVTYIKPHGTIPLINFGGTEVLNLTYQENNGAAFSLLQGKQAFLIVITAIILIIAIVFLATKKAKNPLLIWAVALVIGGGGNLIDRLINQYVVDFIDFRLIHFAVFNFADICAVCGAGLLILYVILDEVKASKKKKAEKLAAEAAPALEAEKPSDDENARNS